MLETERLILRRFTGADIDHLFALDNDPEVMRYLNGGEPVTREVVEHEILPQFIKASEGDDLLGTEVLQEGPVHEAVDVEAVAAQDVVPLPELDDHVEG